MVTEKILTVDQDDHQTGIEDKEKCHDGEGILHRAFILIVVESDGRVLLSRRSKEKRLWPGYWEMTIASHPKDGESYEEAAAKRLKEELGVEARDMKYLFKFQYQASFGSKGSENEICAALACRYNGKIKENPEEISQVKTAAIEDLKSEMPDYSPWMKIVVRKIINEKIKL